MRCCGRDKGEHMIEKSLTAGSEIDIIIMY